MKYWFIGTTSECNTVIKRIADKIEWVELDKVATINTIKGKTKKAFGIKDYMYNVLTKTQKSKCVTEIPAGYQE